jgi:hypothetical protein
VESISLYFSSAPGVTRTRGLLIRSSLLVLYQNLSTLNK